MKQRILYIDNLKAIAIFTVVVGHVFYFSWDRYCDNLWCYLITAYNMPLFFFLSGMFAKDNMNLSQLGRKAKQLLIPTLVVGGIYTFIKDAFSQLFFEPAHYGYWFLPTLFVMFSFFYVRCLMAKALRKLFNVRETWMTAFDVLFMLAVWGGSKMMGRFMPEGIYGLSCLGGIAANVIFFWLGFLVWKNKKTLSPLLHKRKDAIYAICFLVFMVMFYYINYSGVETRGLMAKVMALFTLPLVMIFFKDRNFGNGKIQSSLSYIGSHSLEIYVLQYFFLPIKYELTSSVVGGGKLPCYFAGRERFDNALMYRGHQGDRA